MRRRRAVFILSMVLCGLLLMQVSASALCLVVPFDKVVHESSVVWWGKVIGVDHIGIPPGATAPAKASWALKVRIDDVLKGPGAIGEERPVRFGSCGPFILWTRQTAEQYVGDTYLLMGHLPTVCSKRPR